MQAAELKEMQSDTWIVRNTAAAHGRTSRVAPDQTAERHLQYGRIILKQHFLWTMAANREIEDRLYGAVNVHPDYATSGSGLDAGRAR
jgi:hypothetical protein